jgi:ferredoxin
MDIRGRLSSTAGTRLISGVLLGAAISLFPRAWRFAAPAGSPFVAVAGAIAVRSLSLASLAALPMLLIALWRRRFWCRRLCPVGLITESCGRLRPRGAGRAAFGTAAKWPPGRWIVLATLGGAAAGYPFLLWMDPLALFAGFFSVTRIAGGGMPLLGVAGLPIVAAISVWFPGLWCTRICPLGATQDLLALAQRRREVIPGRRMLLATGAGAVLAAPVRLLARSKPPLRPPGNVEETAFKGGCIRCGSCSRVCPSGIIEPALEAADPAGLLAPTLRFSGPRYCLQDCNRCGEVCPTGVIRPLRLEAKNRHVIGIAVIDLSGCYLTQERECGVCLPRCPRGAIVDGFDRKSYTVAVAVAREKCNGCGACVGICPPKVIRVERVAIQ